MIPEECSTKAFKSTGFFEPKRLTLNWTFLVFAATLLGAQQKSNSVKFKPANLLVVPLQKAFDEISFFGMVDRRWGHAVC